MPFCTLTADRIWIETEHAIALPDAFPVPDGHMQVVPRKHVASVYQLQRHEQTAIWELVSEVRERLPWDMKELFV